MAAPCAAGKTNPTQGGPMTIATGTKLPEATMKEKTAACVVDVTTEAFFKGREVILFGVPGAFTGTCSLTHLPGYLENRDAFLARGVDDIAVVAVNDAHVMGAWAQQSGGKGKIHFLSDWNAAFTKALGLRSEEHTSDLQSLMRISYAVF